MMKLYWATGTCALASHIALEEAGAKYEAVKLDFTQGDQRKPEYLKVNPKGRVPALTTERGILTETPAILAWIAQTYPQAKLAPPIRSSSRRRRLSTAICVPPYIRRTRMVGAVRAGRTTPRHKQP